MTRRREGGVKERGAVAGAGKRVGWEEKEWEIRMGRGGRNFVPLVKIH